MTYSKLFAISLSLVILPGCATRYTDASNPVLGFMGGYTEAKGPGELIKVSFGGNGYISKEKVGTYLMFRCAEIAQREGKPYFALYRNILEAVLDKRSPQKAVTTVIFGKPVDHAYILFFDKEESGLLATADVIAQLKPEVRPGSTK